MVRGKFMWLKSFCHYYSTVAIIAAALVYCRYYFHYSAITIIAIALPLLPPHLCYYHRFIMVTITATSVLLPALHHGYIHHYNTWSSNCHKRFCLNAAINSTLLQLFLQHFELSQRLLLVRGYYHCCSSATIVTLFILSLLQHRFYLHISIATIPTTTLLQSPYTTGTFTATALYHQCNTLVISTSTRPFSSTTTASLLLWPLF